MPSMMEATMGYGMTWAMGLFCLLGLVLLVLVVGALIKYLFFSGKDK